MGGSISMPLGQPAEASCNRRQPFSRFSLGPDHLMGSRISTPTPLYSAGICMYLAEPMAGPEGHAYVASSSSTRFSPVSGAEKAARAEPPQPEDS
eukprot:4981257-Pyramimonas_sp.AAC.1